VRDFGAGIPDVFEILRFGLRAGGMIHRVESAVVKGYQDLVVWQRSVDLAVRVSEVTEAFPRREIYGLAAQMRRSAVSVPSNIAEGHGRRHLGDYLHHLSIANGSLMELETQIVIAARRGYLNPALDRELSDCSGEVGRMLAGLSRSLRKRRKET
jgi:four helix bundle protein